MVRVNADILEWSQTQSVPNQRNGNVSHLSGSYTIPPQLAWQCYCRFSRELVPLGQLVSTMIRLALRTLPLFAVIVGFAMALGAYMTFSGVRGAYLSLLQSRMQMVAEDLNNDIQAAILVGIRLPEQATLPAVLARRAGSDPLILSIDVLAPNGTILFSSLAERAGRTAISDDDTTIQAFSLAIVNDLGEPVGQIRVRYNRAETSRRIAGLARGIVAGAVPISLLAILAGSIATFLVLTRLHRRAKRAIAGTMDGALSAASRELQDLEAGQHG
jgi:hypothetical protein